MRCPRCDIAIPIGGELCTKCGYNVYTKKTDPSWHQPVPKPVPPEPTPIPPAPKPVPPAPKPVPPAPKPEPPAPKLTPPAPKPKKHWFRNIFLTLLACLIGRSVGTMAGSLLAQIELGDVSFRQETVQDTANPAFENYLTQRGLSYVPKLRKSECIIAELEGGYFEVLEYGHTGDRLTEFYETIYLSTDGYSAVEAETFKSNARTLFDSFLNPLYASMEEEMQGSYFILRIHYRKLDNKDVIQALINDGLVDANSLAGDSVQYISLEETIEEYIANGGIQR